MLNNSHLTLGSLKTTPHRVSKAWSCAVGHTSLTDSHVHVILILRLQKLIFFLLILLWPQTWEYVLDSLNHRRLTASQPGTGRGSFAAFSGFLWEDGPSLNGTHVPKSVSLSPPPRQLSPSPSPKTSLSAASCFSNSARTETVERGK